ncbi:ABC transporter permease [Desulfoscipio gibsoniae]|uniref:ABC-type sulfate transport system, permease component n=1 Tax=Desulfoscipio gibsoniae DSM 7213 TaxID=767817 RepID=R4KCT7_9FIRM|nr:ABC transporter permease [Desulfoscipio gibsoniae]AGL00399.1 ABC-type sulfate transport system, permease component [Desulfoscipio gibsoniae DSM 7213]
MKLKTEKLYLTSAFLGLLILLFIMYPIINSLITTDGQILLQTLRDREVLAAIWNSIYTATITTMIVFIFGVPFAYFLARNEFRGKRLVESIIDIPIVIPHTVVGIILLTVLSQQCWLGRLLENLGLEVVGTRIGIVTAMTFVSMPLLINAAKDSFAAISPKLEYVSRTLGATHMQTFILITFSVGWRGILTGMILTWARSISEFGAVIILTYHPMIAPTLIFDRFNSFGLEYSKPVSAILIAISLAIFIVLRVIAQRGVRDAGNT